MKELLKIQQGLKAPKGQYNSFGKYKYRSCEDILEAVKPLLAECGVTLTLSDDICAFGDRVYVKATATIVSGTGETLSVTAFAREEETKKGMDASQITGTASSYARKYALNGLFCIDDTKDADATDNGSGAAPATPSAAVSEQDLEDAIDDLYQSSDRASFEAAWARHPEYKTNEKFLAAAKAVAKKYPRP